jgi:uncharacterized membrane protein YvbJ
MPYCRMCGKKLENAFVYCPYCGHKNDLVMGESEHPHHGQKAPAPSKRIVTLTIIFLFVFFPVGLSLMWLYKPFSKTTRTIITMLFIGILMVLFVRVYIEIIFGRLDGLDIDGILEGL